MNEKKAKAVEWAEGLVAKINADERSYVKYKESRPITDIKNMIETSAELFGDNVAFMQKDNNNEPYRKILYKEALADVNGLGTALISKGLKGKRIAVIGENCYQWATSYLAAVCGTGIVVPLDKELSAEELKNLVIRADVECVLFQKKFEDMFKEMKDSGDTKLNVLVNFTSEEEKDGVYSWSQLMEEGKKLVEEGNREFTDAEIDNEAMSIILFTSGTTGKSKGVMLSHKNIAADLMIAPTVFKVFPTDIFFSVLPLHHTYECTCNFLMPLYKGAAIAYCQGLKYITKNLEEVKPTMFLGVPAVFEKLYSTIWKTVKKQGKEDLLKKVIRINRKTKKVGIDLGKVFFKQITAVFGGRMRCLICGGAAINPEVLDGIRDFGILALQGYGLTECAPMGALNPDTAPNSASIGVRFPGADLKVVNINEEGIGEICVHGDNVMLGYMDMPEETAAVIDSEGWFHTGDMGYMDSDGYAYITGRKKNVIITKNGKNVYPEELEYQLSLVPFIEEVFVFEGESSDEKSTTIVASIKLDQEAVEEMLGADYTEEQAKEMVWKEVDKINADAPFYRKIKKVIIRKSDFIKNSSKKLIRYAEDNKKEG
ncbi:MAG: AMP-binding protein [Anaerovoracaceae bacterium]|nr:AMP-binding protein [Anaerovoracaceae bacterium]